MGNETIQLIVARVFPTLTPPEEGEDLKAYAGRVLDAIVACPVLGTPADKVTAAMVCLLMVYPEDGPEHELLREDMRATHKLGDVLREIWDLETGQLVNPSSFDLLTKMNKLPLGLISMWYTKEANK